ncbi:MAG: ribbon-helix-helix protein, CopG family [Terriglobia bacterium]
MGERVTIRLDAQHARILHQLEKLSGTSKSKVIRSSLRSYWRTVMQESGPTAWERYQRLYPRLTPHRKGAPLHERARNVSRLLKEKLLAKRREGTL